MTYQVSKKKDFTVDPTRQSASVSSDMKMGNDMSGHHMHIEVFKSSADLDYR